MTIDPEIQKKINFQEYSATDTHEFRTWIDILAEKIRVPFWIVSVLIAILIYLGGWLITLFIGYERKYLESYFFIIGSVTISYVFLMIRIGVQKIHVSYEQLRPCFLQNDEEYRSVIHKWFGRIVNIRYQLISTIVLILFAFIVVFLSFYHPEILSRINIKSFRPSIVTPYWYEQDYLLVKSILFFYYGIFCAIALGTATPMLVINLFFLWDLRNFTVIPLPNLVLFRLRKTTNFYIFVALSWLLGVAIVAVSLYKDIDVTLTIILIILTLIGTLTFFIPQVIYRIYLDRSYALSSQIVLQSFYNSLNIKLIENNQVAEKFMHLADEFSLPDLVEYFQSAKLWVYNLSDLFLFALGHIVTIGCVFLDKIVSL